MFYPKNIIEFEFFPSNLPPCFISYDAAAMYDEICAWASGVNMKWSVPLSFNGFKNEKARRKFSIPNIYHFAKAIQCLKKYENEIFNIYNKSNISLTKPLKGIPPKPRKISSIKGYPYKRKSQNISDTKKIVQDLYQDNSFEIKLDIMSFFDSVYTHTIPWAIHSKEEAKKCSGKLCGDKIDTCISSLNHGQTNGLLVGNAVSRIISEIILCTVDYQIKRKFPNINIVRYVDDYSIYLKNQYEINLIISFIRKELSKFELQLNENKIIINESPFIFGNMWVEEIKLFIHHSSDSFLSKIINLYKQYKDISIIKYGLKILSKNKLSAKDWENLESRIINLWVTFPSLSKEIIDILLNKRDLVRIRNLTKAIYTVIDTGLLLNYDEEVIWAVWFAKVFNIRINGQYTKNIIESRNSLAIIILIDILSSSSKNIPKEVNNALSNLLNELDEKENDIADGIMWTNYWLLTYEINLNKWLTKIKKIDFASNNDFFKSLIKKKINFYDKEFEYKTVENNEINQIGFVTKKEFSSAIRKIKDLYSKISSLEEDGDEIIEIVDDLFEDLNYDFSLY